MKLIDADMIPNYKLDVLLEAGEMKVPRKFRIAHWKDIEEVPMVDPESLPIVKQLRAELEKVEKERDAAIKELHGKCSVCKSYAPFHRRDKCLNCKWDNASPACLIEYQEDNWEWCGVQGENNS